MKMKNISNHHPVVFFVTTSSCSTWNFTAPPAIYAKNTRHCGRQMIYGFAARVPLATKLTSGMQEPRYNHPNWRWCINFFYASTSQQEKQKLIRAPASGFQKTFFTAKRGHFQLFADNLLKNLDVWNVEVSPFSQILIRSIPQEHHRKFSPFRPRSEIYWVD